VQSSLGHIHTVKAIDCKFLPSVPAAEEPTTQLTTLETTPSIPAPVQGPQRYRNEVQVTVPTLDTSQYQEVTPADENTPALSTIRFGRPVYPPGTYWQATVHNTQESLSQLELSSYTAAINSLHLQP